MRARTLVISLVQILLCLSVVSVSQAQIASTVIRVGLPLPDDTSNANITNIRGTTQNQVGGIAFNVATGSGSRLWHQAANGAISLTSQSIVDDLEQGLFETSSFGLDNNGNFIYSANSDNPTASLTGLDGVWKNNSLILNELDAVPGLNKQFSTFNSRPQVTSNGKPYWTGGFSSIQGGSTLARALFFGEDAAILLRGGDNISGVDENLSDTGIGFNKRISEDGNHYIVEATLDVAEPINGLVVVDGTALSLGGSLLREGTQIPVTIGGQNSEAWDSFDFLGINDNGNFMLTGDTDGNTETDEFVANQNGILLREGDELNGLPLRDSIDAASMNQNGDIALLWDVEDQNEFGQTVEREVLILNNKIVLKEGDALDWNGDGIIDVADNDSILSDFRGLTGFDTIKVSPRDEDGNVVITFVGTASTLLGDTEAGFKLTACASDTENCGSGKAEEFCTAIKAQNNKIVVICL